MDGACVWCESASAPLPPATTHDHLKLISRHNDNIRINNAGNSSDSRPLTTWLLTTSFSLSEERQCARSCVRWRVVAREIVSVNCARYERCPSQIDASCYIFILIDYPLQPTTTTSNLPPPPPICHTTPSNLLYYPPLFTHPLHGTIKVHSCQIAHPSALWPFDEKLREIER